MANPEITTGEEQLAFYDAIGRAVSQWAHVEHGLYHIASRAFKGEDRGALAFGFFSIENFRSKLAFVDRTFGTADFFDEFEVEWTVLRDHIRSLSSRRNEIAHSRVIVYPSSKPGRRYAIVPTFAPEPARKQKIPLAPPGSLCVKDIDLAARQFATASNQLLGLYYRLGGQDDPFAESSQQGPQPRTIAQIRSQIYEMLPQRGGS